MQTAMLGGLFDTVVRNAIFAHPTKAERLNALFAASPTVSRRVERKAGPIPFRMADI
jgi:hypothetical protein